MYGTSIPTSDQDYRAIYLPDIKDCVLGKVKDAYEDKSEDDTSYFTLQHFLNMANQGQSVAIELLCAPMDKIIINSPLWMELHNNRKMFFTKSMHSFLGYAKTMAGKYSSRVDRLKETEAVISVLYKNLYYWKTEVTGDYIRLSNVWDELPESLNCIKTTNERNKHTDKRVYQVCGRELQATVTVNHAYEVIKAIYDSYGERVKKAKDGDIEWKSFMHAFRAAYQVKEIALTGDLKFPLKDAEWLRELRLGKFNFLELGLDKKLDDLIAETQELIDKSNLPDKIDKSFSEAFILKAYGLA